MAHPNEELVRRGYEAFNTADVETLRELFADTTIFHEPGRSPVSGDYQGLDQVLGFFGTLTERSGGTFRATLHDVVANDEHAVYGMQGVSCPAVSRPTMAEMPN